MKQILKLIFKFMPAALFLASPLLVWAYNVPGETQSGLNQISSLFSTGGLSGSRSLTELIINIIRIMLLFVGSIAIIFVIIGGYQYIASAGNEEAAEKGKKTLINAIIGVVIVVLSYAIINVISNFATGRR